MDVCGGRCAIEVALWGIVGYGRASGSGWRGSSHSSTSIRMTSTHGFRDRRPVAFRGTFDYTLDAKNRLTVPAKFRPVFADGVVLAKGTERCVAIWTPDEFSNYVSAALEGLHPLSQRAGALDVLGFV